jgi:hypothetical protein
MAGYKPHVDRHSLGDSLHPPNPINRSISLPSSRHDAFSVVLQKDRVGRAEQRRLTIPQ